MKLKTTDTFPFFFFHLIFHFFFSSFPILQPNKQTNKQNTTQFRLALSFYHHLRDLGVRAMTNAGTARDKSHHYDGAQRAYVDAANLLSASSSLTTTTTTSNEPEGLGLVLERQRMLGLVRRQASLSMRHHVHQTFKRGCYKMKGVWKDRDYNTAILLLDEAVEAGEIYYSSLVSWKMMVKKKKYFLFFYFF